MSRCSDFIRTFSTVGQGPSKLEEAGRIKRILLYMEAFAGIYRHCPEVVCMDSHIEKTGVARCMRGCGYVDRGALPGSKWLALAPATCLSPLLSTEVQ